MSPLSQTTSSSLRQFLLLAPANANASKAFAAVNGSQQRRNASSGHAPLESSRLKVIAKPIN